jgi:hypothetical protein
MLILPLLLNKLKLEFLTGKINFWRLKIDLRWEIRNSSLGFLTYPKILHILFCIMEQMTTLQFPPSILELCQLLCKLLLMSLKLPPTLAYSKSFSLLFLFVYIISSYIDKRSFYFILILFVIYFNLRLFYGLFKFSFLFFNQFFN